MGKNNFFPKDSELGRIPLGEYTLRYGYYPPEDGWVYRLYHNESHIQVIYPKEIPFTELQSVIDMLKKELGKHETSI